MRGVALVALALTALPTAAHDLITAESAQAYLARQERLDLVIDGKGPSSERAAALVEMGRLLDEIRDLFNRDIEAHGRVQGLPSNFLMNELRARGNGLEWSASRGYFSANLAYYREALGLDPGGATTAEASFRLLQGWFYDSFTQDPLAPAAQSPAQLAGQIRIAEDYLHRYPGHAGREEASFILAVHYMQAANSGPREKKSGYARKARDAAGVYQLSYPDSLRAATLTALLERIDGR
jgi:hypothetical protein